MVQVEKTTDFQLSVPDQPGELARLAANLKRAQVNLRALWGFGIGQGNAEIICVPEDAVAFRKFADQEGLRYREREVTYLTGDDRLGVLVETFERIARANVNVHAVDVVAAGGKFASYLWVDDKERPALERALSGA
jgi:hypothetical protein